MWWADALAGLVLVFGIYAFAVLVGARTRWFNRKTARTAEELYDNYADATRQQRRYAKRHSPERRDDGTPGAGPGQS